jgi:hypothetical protein
MFRQSCAINFGKKKCLGNILGDFLHESIWSPCAQTDGNDVTAQTVVHLQGSHHLLLPPPFLSEV